MEPSHPYNKISKQLAAQISTSYSDEDCVKLLFSAEELCLKSINEAHDLYNSLLKEPYFLDIKN